MRPPVLIDNALAPLPSLSLFSRSAIYSLSPAAKNSADSAVSATPDAETDSVPRVHVLRRFLRNFRQIVSVRMVGQQEESVQCAVLFRRFSRRKDTPAFSPCAVQRFHARFRPLPQFLNRPELNRFGRAGLCAGGRHVALLPVVAEGAFVNVSVVLASVQHAERTGRDAVAAAVADVGLHIDIAELVVDDAAGRAGLLTGRFHAVLAHVAHHQPAAGFAAARLRPPARQRRRAATSSRSSGWCCRRNCR